MTSKIYEAPDGMLYCGDTIEVLRTLPEESAHCVIADPPYNIGKNFGNGKQADRRADYHQWLWDVWAACGRVVRAGGFLVYTNRIAHIPMGMLAIPEPWRFFHLEVWHEPLSFGGIFYGVAPHWTPIFIYVKGKPWRPFRSALVMSDVHSVSVVAGSARTRINHPTVKPEALIRDFVLHYTREGEVILDPFIGSGTTCVVARKLGRRWIGIDLNAEYLMMAQRRLEGVSLAFPPAG